MESSISQTLSVGFFGDTATGTYSKTWSHSFAIQLEDFGIERKSVGTDVLQTLHLEMSTSAAYAAVEMCDTRNRSQVQHDTAEAPLSSRASRRI